MSSSKNGWIEVAKVLSADGEAKILCPDCKQEFLKTQEIELNSADTMEKRIYCELCGAQNFMRLSKK